MLGCSTPPSVCGQCLQNSYFLRPVLLPSSFVHFSYQTARRLLNDFPEAASDDCRGLWGSFRCASCEHIMTASCNNRRRTHPDRHAAHTMICVFVYSCLRLAAAGSTTIHHICFTEACAHIHTHTPNQNGRLLHQFAAECSVYIQELLFRHVKDVV